MSEKVVLPCHFYNYNALIIILFQIDALYSIYSIVQSQFFFINEMSMYLDYLFFFEENLMVHLSIENYAM